jgi:hypothetical protein
MKKSKKHPKIKIESFGRYTKWKRGSRELPKILEFTNTIDCLEGQEFGMILHITGGKGSKLDYRIIHPDFTDDNGNIEPDFTGTYLVNTNDYKFYIGDCIWLPLEDKCGTWIVQVEFERKIVAEEKFDLILSK